MRERIVVIGGNGFLGREICRMADELGMSVTSVDLSGEPADRPELLGLGIYWVRADLFHRRLWGSYLQGCNAVVHCVGTFKEKPAEGRTHEHLNYEAACQVGEAAVQYQVNRFVYVSAGAALPPAPSTYLETKRRAEAYLTSLPLQLVVLRPDLLYGAASPVSLRYKYWIDRLGKLPLLRRWVGEIHPLPVEAVAWAAVQAVRLPSPTNLMGVKEMEELAKTRPGA